MSLHEELLQVFAANARTEADQAAMNEIDRLRKENAKLRKQVAASPPPLVVPVLKPAAAPKKQAGLKAAITRKLKGGK